MAIKREREKRTLHPFLFSPHRFNCGTGVAIITSETKIKLGAWHTVTLYRDGLNGLLQLNNGTPVTGQSQVSVGLTPSPPTQHPQQAFWEGPIAESWRPWQMGCFSWRTHATWSFHSRWGFRAGIYPTLTEEEDGICQRCALGCMGTGNRSLSIRISKPRVEEGPS